MPRVNILQTNFTAGELTPRMKGRRDVARYQNGAEKIENAIVLVHGGAERRWGLRYCGTAKHSGVADRATYVLPYVFNRDQAYVLEFGHLYVRVFDIDGGQLVDALDVPIEIVSPYTSAQLAEVSYHQGGDTLLLYHPDVPTQRLQRQSATVWTMQPVPWVVEPFAEVGRQPDARITIDNPAVGAGRTFTTSAVAVPGAPTNAVATPLNGGARITFDPPADTGGAAIIDYEATSSPGGITATATGTTITLAGLTNGTPYTFTVKARNSAGQGPASAASNSVTPSTAFASPTITATVSPSSIYYKVKDGLVIGLDGPTAGSSDGVAPLTAAWRKVSGSENITINNSTSLIPKFRSQGDGTTNTAIFEVEVTDSLGAKGKAQANTAVQHATGWSEGPGTVAP